MQATIKKIPLLQFFKTTPPEIRNDITFIIDFFKTNYHAKCYIVGGAVRDYLLGKECQDYDIECYNIAPDAFEEAMKHVGAEGVGKSFFVYKYHRLDIALPRRETKTGVGHKGFEVSLAAEEREASRRRDFTGNALMYDLEHEQIIDYWQGLHDLKEKVLRVVDPVSFVEDSLRVLRAMQFAARFAFRVEEESCKLCRGISLDDLPKERIFAEFEKMFKGDFPLYGLYCLFELGIAEQLFSVDMDRKNFMVPGRQLLRYQKYFTERLKPYYFLYITVPCWGRERQAVLERLGAPGSYYKYIANTPLLPQKIDCAFVARVAEKKDISDFVGNYHPQVRRFARKLNVWEQPFRIGVSPAQLMAEGFEGKALGDELARQREVSIRRLDEDCSEF
ncbi:MAG TPA: CCA tRNA nucleotidyltransferase [Epsilonproteobacteria bacterium]|nr:CCA tRNA nucleotidyltransferase [Campylobacterota bacterium]